MVGFCNWYEKLKADFSTYSEFSFRGNLLVDFFGKKLPPLLPK